ncbi:MAG: beta-glucosidase family protein [Caulobacteraceae bacterium]
MRPRYRQALLTGVAALITVSAAANPATAQPSPIAPAAAHPWDDRALSADARADLVVKAMTQDEKFAWLSGPTAIAFGSKKIPQGALGSAAYYPAIPRLGIMAQQQTDAGLGIGDMANTRPGDNATALPSSLLLAASFDPAMARETGALIGQEARAKGFNVLLAGGADLIREPRGGRNFEYVSEDPLLTGVIAGASIAGIQSQGVISTTKHFAVNAQETGRVLVSSDLDPGALRESDLLAFEIAIETGKPGAVMPGYNLVNGEWATQNAYLLNDVLKGDWRYPGWVMSDWGATHSTEKAVKAGLDVQSGADLDPKPFFGAPLRGAVAAGRLPQARIDDMVRRQLRSLFAIGVIDNPPSPGGAIDYMAHRLIAQRAAEAGLILLKNDNQILPLAKGARRLLVIGRHADAGVLAGGGSSAVTPTGSLLVKSGVWSQTVYDPSSPLLAIKAEANAADVQFIDGTDPAAAVAAARTADAVILFADEWRGESRDAKGLNLPNDQDALIAAVAAANARTIVVLETGGPVVMPWLKQTPAVLAAFYPGSGGGEAIAGVLFGRVNPSGRLPVTFPASEAQLPRPVQDDPAATTSNPGMAVKGGVFHANYNIEGSDVGYRWYLRQHLTPLFPFGYGLSYSRFEMSDLQLHTDKGVVVASLTVRNTSRRDGADTPQLYAALGGESGFAPRLVGFQRVQLAAGESRRIALRVDPRLLARFDVAHDRWVVASGRYDLRAAGSATDRGLTATVAVAAAQLTP